MSDLTSTVLERPGCRVHVRRREAARGHWVVLCHGAGMDGHMFDAVLPGLPEDVGICAWDARGHGRSALEGPFLYADLAADLDALVDSLGASDLTLVGFSMGGNLVQSYAARHPTSARRLILLDCTDNHGPLSRAERAQLASTGPILRALPWRWTVRASAAACGTEAGTREYAARCMESMGRRRFAEVMAALGEALVPDPAYRLPVPTLLIMGTEDRSGNIASAMRALAARNPATARLVMIEGAAHISTMDRPDAVGRAIAEVLRKPAD